MAAGEQVKWPIIFFYIWHRHKDYSLSVKYLTYLMCKVTSLVPVFLSSHLCLEEETLVVSELPCRSPSWCLWCSYVLPLGVCPGGMSRYWSKVQEAGCSVLLRSCQHLADQEDCFIYFSGCTFIYTSHGDVYLSRESMTLPVLLEHVILHLPKDLSWRSAVYLVVLCLVHLQLIAPNYRNLYLSLLNHPWTISLLCWDLFAC